MANFHTHLGVAATASTALAAAGVYAKVFGLTTAILCAIVGTIGGLLPDIDLDHSAPTKRGFFLGSLIASTLIVVLYANAYYGSRLILDALMLWAGSFVIIRYVLLDTFSRLTVHRGVVHSVPYMAVFALLLVHGLYFGMKLTAFTSWMLGLFLLFGSLVHLMLDEIYSVNAFGLRLKKSFGTAFKFIEFDKPLQYLVLYVIVAVLFFKAPPYQEVWRILSRLTH
ncbi:metal-dependent hydrolase [Moraxella nasibovis]|uniref:metal-dependent hydrolase n=1 Tax=Moraxella nasibovis TaxID=2904120 RepID=UPI0024106BC5|nr:metal-dependent hydrolase [Moraxella nasibovis]WFF38846.1 metal-dependent hydrolase [Moraxella nasibovis]